MSNVIFSIWAFNCPSIIYWQVVSVLPFCGSSFVTAQIHICMSLWWNYLVYIPIHGLFYPASISHCLHNKRFVLSLDNYNSKSSWGFPGGTSGKKPTCQCWRDIRDPGLIPGLGRSSGRGHDNPLQYSCLENPMDSGAQWATVHSVKESDTTERARKSSYLFFFELWLAFLGSLHYISTMNETNQ